MQVHRADNAMIVSVDGLDETTRLGRAVGAVLVPGDIVGLVGTLGAGKTTLTRSIAHGAGVQEEAPVNSPTFTILNIYDTPKFLLCHLDLYRLDSEDELENLGLPDLIARAPLVVEWFERFPHAFPADTLIIKITREGDTGRKFELTPAGEDSEELLDEIEKALGD